MRQRLVVIGNGMAGIACVEQILRHSTKFDITIFGEETHPNYNRILLSSVLAGEKECDEIILNGLDWYQQNDISLKLGVRIVRVDMVNHVVTGDDGSFVEFEKLLLATGSNPFFPDARGIEKTGVYGWRSLDDTRALLAYARPGIKAVVIGGGLLGLECARGLQVRGCDVSVVHLSNRLMDRQLDATGSSYLTRKIEAMGIRVLLGKRTEEILGDGYVEGVRFTDGEEIPAEIVVVAAGIRPNVDLARQAGVDVNRGVLVNDRMETSHPDVFAVGECVEHRGMVYGLVAPLIEQGKVLAATLCKGAAAEYEGSVLAAKLKIMGVDVFSAGDPDEKTPGIEVIRYEDPGSGIYKRLAVKDNKLAGVILVGDASDSHRYMEWLRQGTDLTLMRRQLLLPESSADKGSHLAELSDTETVCGCMGVTKGTIISAIHEKSIRTFAQLKESTRASTGCGSCSGMCQQILKAVAPDFEEEAKRVLCGCIPFPEEQLREMIRGQQLKNVQSVLDIYGNGKGCEKCKPALSYMVDVVWSGHHHEDRSARFINDRVHANIQNDGTFSVVPRIRGGVTSPKELRRIADVAEKYEVPLVKITGSQRIDLLGVKKADLPAVWSDLGMPSGQAYTKGLRMVKTCVGKEYCRFGTQNSLDTGVELEKRLENLFTPHKTKLAVVGCPRNCAEATVKDIGLVGQEGSWQVVVGGAAGKVVRKADLLVTVETTEEALEAAELFFQYYRENANYLERSYDFVEHLGIEKIRKETVYAPEKQRKSLLARLRRAKTISRDAWLEGEAPLNPTQFVQIQPLDRVY